LLARNIRAQLKGRPPRPFHLFAWLLWRVVYLGKLPGFERKARVLMDWLLELFFPRDTVQTLDVDRH
jgi:NADH dehydrogenase